MKKGQKPFDTFKLMLIALVAVAILGILMGFLSGNIKFAPEPEPQPQQCVKWRDVPEINQTNCWLVYYVIGEKDNQIMLESVACFSHTENITNVSTESGIYIGDIYLPAKKVCVEYVKNATR